ncbi:MAG: adaptor protein MecA [Lachnospiraceae bacterium]|nr:adaptor protein MecA [Lachnospiraceae bacterium]
MTIELINDNQIKCTLTKEDLFARQLKISELAYGSDKVKELFAEICKKAFVEYNFDFEDTPLMIEAIPVSADCLILFMTKVNDPEELDSRFSHFTSPSDEVTDPVISPEERVYADEIINCMEQLNKLLTNPLATRIFNPDENQKHKDETVVRSISKIFRFSSLDEVIRVAKAIAKIYRGNNTLYKDADKGIYYLIMNISEHTAPEFNKVCNIVSEYISPEMTGHGVTEDYIREHCEVITGDKAVQVLKKF